MKAKNAEMKTTTTPMTKTELKEFLRPFLKTRESILTMDDLDELEIDVFLNEVSWSLPQWWETPDEVADLFADFFACEVA